MSMIARLWIFGISVTLMFIGLGSISYYKARQLLADLDEVAGTQLPAVRAMTLVDMSHDGLRGILFQGLYERGEGRYDEVAPLAKEYQEMGQKMREDLNSISKLNVNPTTLAAIEAAHESIEAYIVLGESILQRAATQQKVGADDLKNFMERFEVLEGKLEKLGGLIEADAYKSRDSGKNALKISAIITTFGSVFCLIFMIYVIRSIARVTREMLSEIASSERSVSQASTELGNAIQELSSGASATAAALEETAASIEILNRNITDTSVGATKAADLSESSQKLAHESDQEITSLYGAMNSISESSTKIREIINVIDDLSFQTNLLALNAAVEAARAGEEGKGFAVVADAVRNLAQRSAAAAKDIGQMINDSGTKIKAGQQIANSSTEVLKRMIDAIQRVREFNEKIAETASDQKNGMDQISNAIREIDSSSQKTALFSESVQRAASDLSQQSRSLANLVDVMRATFLGYRQA